MKKKISAFLSVLLTLSATGVSASAEVSVEPQFQMHGNKCGEVIIMSDIDRDIYVGITQNSQDGTYVYYNTVIAANTEDPVYSFTLEGKDDVTYTVSIGVAEFKGSDKLRNLSDEVVVYDIDEITEEAVSGYKYSYTVTQGEELYYVITAEKNKNEANIYTTEKTFYFPVSDYSVGDANSDGVVNIRDAAAISRVLAYGEEIPQWADFNGDGKTNVRDAAAIAMKMASGQ